MSTMRAPLYQRIGQFSVASIILSTVLCGGCNQPNNPPVIESLTAESLEVKQSENTSIECIAYDPDEDELSYHWDITGGNISGQGPTITWKAPSRCANYSVTVTVADGRGGQASRQVKIRVIKPG